MKKCPYCAEEIQDEAILCRHCGKSLVAPSHARRAWLLAIIGGVIIILFATSMALYDPDATGTVADTAAAAAAEPVRIPDDTVEFENGAMEIEAGKFLVWRWTTNSLRPYCVSTGRIVGVSGGNRDFDLFVFDEDGLLNWKNGTNPVPVYQSGRVSAATMDVHTHQPGITYYVVVSNTFSTVTAKAVDVIGARVICSAYLVL